MRASMHHEKTRLSGPVHPPAAAGVAPAELLPQGLVVVMVVGGGWVGGWVGGWDAGGRDAWRCRPCPPCA